MTNTRAIHCYHLLVLALAIGCGDSSPDADDGDTGSTGGTLATGIHAATGDDTQAVRDTDDAATATSTDGGASTGDTGQVTPEEPIALGMAGGYAILSKTGISTVPTSAITGDIGVSPAAATYITGFSLTADATDEFATSPQVVGRVYAADYAPPTPSLLTTAVVDMESAFTDAAGRAPDRTELGAGDIGGLNLEPGVYKWGTGLLIPTDVMLTGDATDVWIFEIAQDLTVANGARVVLSGGAAAHNVFWQVEGTVELGTTAHLEGIVLTRTSVTLGTGATVIGRLLAQTAVDLDAGTVTAPASQ